MTHSPSLAMRRYSIEPRTRKYVKGGGFLSFSRKHKNNTGVDVLKNASKKLVHETGEFLGNQIADAVSKSNDDKIAKSEPVEEIIIQPEERAEVLNKLRQVFF